MVRLVTWLVLLAGLAWGGWWLWHHADEVAERLQPPASEVSLRVPADDPLAVRAVGRVEPVERIEVAGPSRFSVVVDRLLVDEGDEVAVDQVIALLDTEAVEEAEVAAQEAELANAELELERAERLVSDDVSSRKVYDEALYRRDLAIARLAKAEAELARSRVRSPIAGEVLAVHARDGERVGPDGIVEIADTSTMKVVAEVFEEQVGRVRLGQTATVESPALHQPLTGAVHKIAAKIGRRDLLETDPIADLETRVVEVEILLDEPERAAELTNLRVQVRIESSGLVARGG